MLLPTIPRKGDSIVKSDQLVFRPSPVGVALFLFSIAAGIAVTIWIQNPVGVIAGILIGLYLLFAIRVADQWEKVAVLRFGRYIGLRGPGLFHMIPVVDTLSRFVDQRGRVASVSAEW